MEENKVESWCEFINNHQKKYKDEYGVPFNAPKEEEEKKDARKEI